MGYIKQHSSSHFEIRHQIREWEFESVHLAFSPNAKFLTVVNPEIHVFNIESGELVSKFVHRSDMLMVNWNQTGDKLAAGGKNGQTIILDMRTLNGDV